MKYNWSAVGHEVQKIFLQQAIKNDRVAHAYLFTGPAHIGKTAVALDFARIILCAGKSRPCGECPACGQQLAANPDFFLLDQDEQISVDQIRSLKSKFSFKPFAGKRKVAVIANAENLDTPAANALLKIFEEPSAETFLILTCSKIGSLPLTIQSRAQRINFFPVPEDQISAWIRDKGKSLQKQQIPELNLGRLGLVKRMSTEPEYLKEWQDRQAILERLLSSGDLGRMQISSDLGARETDELKIVFEQWLFTIDAMLLNNQTDVSIKKLIKALQSIFEASQNLRYNANKRLVLDNAVLRLES